MDDLPEKVRNYLSENYINEYLQGYRTTKELNNGQTSYSIEIFKDEKLYLLEFSADGDLEECLINPIYEKDIYEGFFFRDDEL